ncbi:MAG: hypothetical protein CMH64_02000 [Nanoarchaeota archaeon]|nr:hypothetical protein [Nanoarchaeota archaeon]|tara:strand:- start:730 stop:981 length:252 start_codon:yes stop_codon:yes gene_type:complete
MKQINLKLPDNLLKAAQRYVEHFGFRNIQDLATESIREKVFENSEYDNTFTEKEIELIEALIVHSIKNNKLSSEEELMKILRE